MKNAISRSRRPDAVTTRSRSWVRAWLKTPPTPEEQRAVDADREKARLRVGESSAAMLRWLGDFAERVLPTSETDEKRLVERFMETGDKKASTVLVARIDAEWELREFIRGQGLQQRNARGEQGGLVFGGPHDPNLYAKDSDMLRRLQAGVRQCLRTMREAKPQNEESPQFDFPPSSSIVGLTAARRPDGTVLVSFVAAPGLEAAFWTAATLLLTGMGGFRFCDREHCDRPFVPERKWQRFCGALCASRERQARYRESKPELAEQRRARHMRRCVKVLPKELAEELGGDVTVPRRRRRKTGE